jgi:hypothetical protein
VLPHASVEGITKLTHVKKRTGAVHHRAVSSRLLGQEDLV